MLLQRGISLQTDFNILLELTGPDEMKLPIYRCQFSYGIPILSVLKTYIKRGTISYYSL